MIAVNGMPDHLHIFVGLHPTQAISDLMRVIKGESSEWIISIKLVPGRFRWKEGYCSFSYGRSQVESVYNYVMNQKMHHKKKSFLEEYVQLLHKFDIPFDERYIFTPIN